MNMSYCRYRNTLNDLRDCIYDATYHIRAEAEYNVSPEEIAAFRQMVYDMHEFPAYEVGCIDEDGNLDDDALEKACDAMSREYREDMDESEW